MISRMRVDRVRSGPSKTQFAGNELEFSREIRRGEEPTRRSRTPSSLTSEVPRLVRDGVGSPQRGDCGRSTVDFAGERTRAAHRARSRRPPRGLVGLGARGGGSLEAPLRRFAARDFRDRLRVGSIRNSYARALAAAGERIVADDPAENERHRAQTGPEPEGGHGSNSVRRKRRFDRLWKGRDSATPGSIEGDSGRFLGRIFEALGPQVTSGDSALFGAGSRAGFHRFYRG